MRDEFDPVMTLDWAPEAYNVWLATGFSVRAASRAEAEAQAAAWLATLLANAGSPDAVAPDITVTRPAQNLEGAAVLALQLMALEKKGVTLSNASTGFAPNSKQVTRRISRRLVHF